MSVAIQLLIVNLIGGVIGPWVVGRASDALRPEYGEAGIRYAMWVTVGIAACFAVLGFTGHQYAMVWQYDQATQGSARGHAELADGSKVELNTGSAIDIAVAYSGGRWPSISLILAFSSSLRVRSISLRAAASSSGSTVSVFSTWLAFNFCPAVLFSGGVRSAS